MYIHLAYGNKVLSSTTLYVKATRLPRVAVHNAKRGFAVSTGPSTSRRANPEPVCGIGKASKMKRSAPKAGTPKAKRPRPEVPEYHLSPSVRTLDGEIVWPAPSDQIEKARNFILEW